MIDGLLVKEVPMPDLLLRPLTEDETTELRRWRMARRWKPGSGNGPASAGTPTKAGVSVRSWRWSALNEKTVRRWITRFNAQGLPGLTDAPRQGRPTTYTPEEVGTVIATSLTAGRSGAPLRQLDPGSAGRLPPRGTTGSRSSGAGSGRSCRPKGCAGGPRRPGLASGSIPPSPKKGGDRHPLRHPTRRQRRDLSGRNGTGERQKSSRNSLLRADPTGARRVRAKQEIDYGRRGKGYIFGAFEPATGEALTAPMLDGRRPTGSIFWTWSRPGSIPMSSAFTPSSTT